MSSGFQVVGTSKRAPFTLKLHRSEGMVLIAMNWKSDRPPDDFVGFAIEYRPPGRTTFKAVSNRLSFDAAAGGTPQSTLRAPIQKFRWVHFPFEADLKGAFTYRVTPMSMSADGTLTKGDPQTADIVLARETYPGKLNVAFTRGFVSSQAFVNQFQKFGAIDTLLPTGDAKFGLDFTPTHPKTATVLPWMGFEARGALLDVLDQAVADSTCTVRVIAYDLNEPEIVDRLKALGDRLTVIIDDSAGHGAPDSAETRSESALRSTAGDAHVKRQHMGSLQHNKVIIVTGTRQKKVVCGSTNFSWRGLYVQNNNAVVLTGAAAVAAFGTAFDAYFASDRPADFGASPAADWHPLGLRGIDADVAFSPHAADNALLAQVADDVRTATSSVFYSLAFLGQTKGPIRDAITEITERDDLFVYGMADTKVGGIRLHTPHGNLAPVSPSALTANVPAPFDVEPTGGSGVRLHHKFVVIDADKPTARVYVGSYNFSQPADISNGENLLRIRDRRVAVAYMVEAVRIFDHYEFRARQQTGSSAVKVLALRRPPKDGRELPWFDRDYTDEQRARDRLMFA